VLVGTVAMLLGPFENISAADANALRAAQQILLTGCGPSSATVTVRDVTLLVDAAANHPDQRIALSGGGGISTPRLMLTTLDQVLTNRSAGCPPFDSALRHLIHATLDSG